MKLRKRHLQVFRILTRLDFQKEAPVQMCQMLKEALMLLSVTPCHVVEVRLLQ